MNDINNKKIEVGDIIYYAKFSTIQEGRVLKIFDNAMNVSCKRQYGTVQDNTPLKEQKDSKRINLWNSRTEILIKRKRRR